MQNTKKPDSESVIVINGQNSFDNLPSYPTYNNHIVQMSGQIQDLGKNS